jgi:hypothetical protein
MNGIPKTGRQHENNPLRFARHTGQAHAQQKTPPKSCFYTACQYLKTPVNEEVGGELINPSPHHVKSDSPG